MNIITRTKSLINNFVAGSLKKSHVGGNTDFLKYLSYESLCVNGELSLVQQQNLFKRNVDMVDIEPHAKCNRVCSFCPNNDGQRMNNKALMPDDVFMKIISGLKEINYDKGFRFSRFCEPMAHDHIYEMITQCRALLPDVNMDMVSNGDYLTENRVELLADAGLDVLRISVYLPDKETWNHDAARKYTEKIAKRAGLIIDEEHKGIHSLTTSLKGAPLKIYSTCHNYGSDRVGNDRGGSVKNMIDRSYKRISPCPPVFCNVTIDYDGKVMPCCNLRSDFPGHDAYIIGDLSLQKNNIFNIYGGVAWERWRQQLAMVGPKGAPCLRCKHKAFSDKSLKRLDMKINKTFEKDGITI